MARRTRRLLSAGVVAFTLISTLGTAGATQAAARESTSDERERCAVTRTGEYPRTEPAAAGLDPAKLADALGYASLNGANTIKVFRHGCLVGQGLRDGLLERVPANNFGQTKTIVAFATGIAEQQGMVDIDAPIGRYLPAGLGDAAHRKITLRNLLHSAAGVQHNLVRGLNLVADQSRFRDFFTAPVDHEPDTYFEFDEIGPSVVTAILQRQINAREPGMDFQDWVQRELFDRLGIPESAYFWQRDRSGNTTGYSQLWLRPLEFGRLGELLLRQGSYAGEQIVPRRFLRELRAPGPANCGFGFYVWLNSCKPGQTQINTSYPQRRDYGGIPWIESAPSDMYFTLGLGDSTWVIPSLDMVITRSGEQELDAVPGALRGDLEGAFPGNAGGPGDHEFFRKLMAAITDMPGSVRDTIANSGPYDRPPEVGIDLTPFVDPLDAPLGSYLSLGPGAAQGCGPLGCEGEPNDGLRWLADAPRTIPGILGSEVRPDG